MNPWRKRVRAGATRAVTRIAVVSALGVGGATTSVFPQEGGPLFTFGLSSKLKASDNENLAPVSEGATILSETELSFGFESVTRTQALRFSLSDVLIVGEGPDAPAEAGFQGPDAFLSYQRFTRNTRLEFSARLDTRDLGADLTEADLLLDPDDLITDPGILTTRTFSFDFETGIEAPFGIDLSLSDVRRDYVDTTDPDLEDSQTRQGELALIFRPDRVTETRLTYSHRNYQANDAIGTERTTRSLTLGASRSLDPVTRIAGRLGWTEIDGTSGFRSGVTGSLTFSRELSAGRWEAELAHELTSAGRRTDMTVTRGFEFPLGELELTLGTSVPAGGEPQPIGGITYTRALRDQSLRLAFFSLVAVGADSDVQRSTTANLTYNFELNERDSLALKADYSWLTDADAGSIADRTRLSLTASYNRDLTRDWRLETGYTHRLKQTEGNPTARSNTLFMTLQRDFAWRP